MVKPDIYDMIRGWDVEFRLVSPPSRQETIKAAWVDIRRIWSKEAVDGKLIVEHDIYIIPDMLFECIRYGNTWVIECEGLILERLPPIRA